MQLRTFIARDMRDALAQARKEMGDDAVIVASQRAKGGGVMVRVALDSPVTDGEDPLPSETEKIEFIGSFEQIFLDGLIKRMRNEPGTQAAPAQSFGRSELFRILRGHRAPEALAHPLAEAAEKSGLSDMTLALASALDQRMRIAPVRPGQSKALILMGPCGAGKTAVAAKIAALAQLSGRRVVLIAADTAGAGAVARLETFAKHLGVPVQRAESADAMAASVAEAVKDDALAIVDSAGFDPRSARARAPFESLAQLPDLEALGVVSATGDAEEVGETVTALMSLGAQRLIVSGLDATRRFGALLAAVTQGAGLAHATRSPFMAGGLETLSPLSLARMLIETDSGSTE